MTSSPRPHLLEVNTIPSLFINKTTEELDLRLKGPIVAESLNICGHHISSGIYPNGWTKSDQSDILRLVFETF